MDVLTQMLKGSPTRDLFKQMHKQTHPQHYSSDLDLVAVEKYPYPHVPFLMDHKCENERLTFAEVILYNDNVMKGVPVFVVRGDAQSGCFDIYEFTGGHHAGPTWTEVFVCRVAHWGEFHEWEASARKRSRDRFDPKGHTHGR